MFLRLDSLKYDVQHKFELVEYIIDGIPKLGVKPSTEYAVCCVYLRNFTLTFCS